MPATTQQLNRLLAEHVASVHSPALDKTDKKTTTSRQRRKVKKNG